MDTTLDLSVLEDRLEAAARRHAEARRSSRARERERLELAALLARHGVPAASAREAVRQDDPRRLPPDLREQLARRLRAECSRQRRYARGRDPRYDINRHIAASRLTDWLEGASAWDAPAPPQGSGRSLNGAFRRHAVRTDRAGGPPRSCHRASPKAGLSAAKAPPTLP